jgi:hypothetical protein
MVIPERKNMDTNDDEHEMFDIAIDSDDDKKSNRPKKGGNTKRSAKVSFP